GSSSKGAKRLRWSRISISSTCMGTFRQEHCLQGNACARGMPGGLPCRRAATGQGGSAVEAGAVPLCLAQQRRPGQIGPCALGDLTHAFDGTVENALGNRDQLAAAGLGVDLDLAAAL